MQENNIKRWTKEDSQTVNEGFFDILKEMGLGGNIVIIILFILSIYAIYIIIERYSTIKKSSLEDEEFLQQIEDAIKHKDLVKAKNLCSENNTPISRMMLKGIDRIDEFGNAFNMSHIWDGFDVINTLSREISLH